MHKTKGPIEKTYLFYDIETTGLNPCFDQIVQFAAIRTDLALNPLERYHIDVRLNCDMVPSPDAFLTHRLPFATMAQGDSELNAILKIHQLVNTPGTISVGYNSLDFDDDFLRFGFYRHLLSPYTHQYDQQCGRMDLYPIAVFYYLFESGAVRWPGGTEPNLKLDNLSRLNELTTGTLHHAMTDVEATLALARKFKAYPETWQKATQYFDRNTEDTLGIQTQALAIHGRFGSVARYQAPVIKLGQHRYYKNQTLWLRLDKSALTSLPIESLATEGCIIRKRRAEPPILIAPTHNDTFPDKPKNIAAIADYYQRYTYPAVPKLDAEAALYEVGFTSPYEAQLFKQFHAAAPADKEKIAATFPNPIHQTLAFRLLARHYHAYLSAQRRQVIEQEWQAQHHAQHSAADYRGNPRLTAAQAKQSIKDRLSQENTDLQAKALLQALEGHVDAIGSI